MSRRCAIFIVLLAMTAACQTLGLHPSNAPSRRVMALAPSAPTEDTASAPVAPPALPTSEILPADSAPTYPPLPDSDHGLLTMTEEGRCDGVCPRYTVTVYDEGTVAWHGELDVQSVGQRRGHLDPPTLSRLRRFLRDTRLPRLALPSYDPVHCSYATRTTLRYGEGESLHEIEDDHCRSPLALTDLEKRIRTLVAVEQWIRDNPPAPGGPLPPGDQLLLTLERTTCFGECPAYDVTVFTDGTVVWNGKRFVRAEGERRTKLDPETIARLKAAFDDALFFERDPAGNLRPPPCVEVNGVHCLARHISGCTDTSHAVLTYQSNHKSQTLDDAHCGDATILSDLEDRVDLLVGTRRWIH